MTEAAEQLPATVAAFIDDVARQTRLRRRERREVHRELVSHFAEAIDAGTPASEAISAFGDPRQAARQLRDAAIAKRTPLDRALTRTARVAAGLALALVVVYAAAAAKLHLTKPVIAIDPIERTRAMLPVPATPEDAAWPKYREAMTALGLAVGGAGGGEGRSSAAAQLGQVKTRSAKRRGVAWDMAEKVGGNASIANNECGCQVGTRPRAAGCASSAG